MKQRIDAASCPLNPVYVVPQEDAAVRRVLALSQAQQERVPDAVQMAAA